MTAQEIIEVVKATGIEVSSFASQDFNIPPEIEELHVVKKAKEIKDEAYKALSLVDRKSEEWKIAYDQYSKLPSPYLLRRNLYTEGIGLGPVEEITQVGGEGMGETYYTVLYFPKHDVYLRIDGTYTSHNGVDYWDGWDSVGEVRPKEKTITVYE